MKLKKKCGACGGRLTTEVELHGSRGRVAGWCNECWREVCEEEAAEKASADSSVRDTPAPLRLEWWPVRGALGMLKRHYGGGRTEEEYGVTLAQALAEAELCGCYCDELA